MKNIVIQRFVNRKIEKNFDSLENLGDFIDVYESMITFANDSAALRSTSKDYMKSFCKKQIEVLKDLYQKDSFLHLNSKKVYKLLQLKEKLSKIEVFEV